MFMSRQRLRLPRKRKRWVARSESRSDHSGRVFQAETHPPILHLQHTLGNQHVAQLIQAKRLTPDGKIIGFQRKVTVGAADERYQQEADRVASQAVNTPDAVAASSMQRAMSPEEDEDQMLQPNPLAASITPVQAKFLTETSRGALQRQSETDEEEAEPIQAKSVGSEDTSSAQRRQQKEAGEAGKARVRLISRKAEVDLDGWGSPLVGDDDSDVTFTPSGDFRSKGFQADMAKLGNADFLAQYYRMQVGLKAGEWVHSGMEERKGLPASGTVPIKAGSKGTVEISVKAHFFMDEKVNNTYDTEFSCSWEVEADLEGKLKFLTGGLRSGGLIGDSEAPFQVSGFEAKETAGNPTTVQFTIVFTSYQFTDIPNVQVGGGIDVGKKGNVSGGITLGNEQTYPGGQLPATFFLLLPVTDIPPPPEPKGTVTFGPMSMLREYSVLFPEPKKGKGQSAVSSAQQDALIRWFQGLNDATKLGIIAGTIPISLEGRASTTGEGGMNLTLSDDRKENVIKILSKFVGNKADFQFRSVGKYEAKTPDQVESQEERTVVVRVWEQISEGESGFQETTP
jgi:hypothetical protein